MPLRDHFRPPVTDRASWEELHGMWPSIMAMRLNSFLPPEYRSGVKIRLGAEVEIGFGAFEAGRSRGFENGTHSNGAPAWEPSSPTLLLDTEEFAPPEYEVRVYDRSGTRRLVAAVEIVSPANKERAESRDAFVSKCHALLQQQVCVAIVDPVTDRSGNLYAELAERIGAAPPAIAAASMYAVSIRLRTSRLRTRVETWPHVLAVGAALPTLPLWLTEAFCVPLELEATYEDTCRGLRIE